VTRAIDACHLRARCSQCHVETVPGGSGGLTRDNDLLLEALDAATEGEQGLEELLQVAGALHLPLDPGVPEDRAVPGQRGPPGGGVEIHIFPPVRPFVGDRPLNHTALLVDARGEDQPLGAAGQRHLHVGPVCVTSAVDPLPERQLSSGPVGDRRPRRAEQRRVDGVRQARLAGPIGPVDHCHTRAGVELDVERHRTHTLIPRDPDAGEPPPPAHRKIVIGAAHPGERTGDTEQPLPALDLLRVASTGEP
jgi:hypothetical protein